MATQTKSPETVYNDDDGNLKGQETVAQAESRRAVTGEEPEEVEETPSVIADRLRMKEEEESRKKLLEQEKASEEAAKRERGEVEESKK